MPATVTRKTRSTSRKTATRKTEIRSMPARATRGPGGRGWGQRIDPTGYSLDVWPEDAPRRTELHFADPIDEQLRFGICGSQASSADIARAAGLKPSMIDRFMQGEDCLTMGQAAEIAPLVGMRLDLQSHIEAFIRAADRGKAKIIRMPCTLAKHFAKRREWRKAKALKADQTSR